MPTAANSPLPHSFAPTPALWTETLAPVKGSYPRNPATTRSQIAFGLESRAQISAAEGRQFEAPSPCFLAGLLRTSVLPIWGMGRELPTGRARRGSLS